MKLEEVEKYIIHRFENEWNPAYEYHNLKHTMDVANSSENIAILEGISVRDTILLKTAAYLHDIGILVQYKEHEKYSVFVAQEILGDFEYTPLDIELVSGLIFSTKMPQVRGSNLQQIICDADLDYLGRVDYFEISSNLRKEWSNLFNQDYTDIQWYMSQKKFLTEHVFLTSSSRKIRNEGKAQNIAKVQALIDNLI
ncbi:MAG: HD domain-containing protein [Bacteroidota bacterium]